MTRENLEKSMQDALSVSQDIKIPDGPVLIDRELLQELRDIIDEESFGTSNVYYVKLRDKLDSITRF